MPTRSVTAGRWIAGAALLLALWLTAQGAVALASETFARPDGIAQALPTPTPFRFLTPTPFVSTAPRTTTTTSQTTTTSPTRTAPSTGGFPMELALPALAGGLAAMGGGSLLFRRKTTH
jgi:hypothetical protein